MARHDRSAGFTLLEVLVSLLAGTLLLVALTWMLGEVREGWQRSNQAVADARQLDGAADAVRAMLERIIVADRRSGETTFAGSSTGLTALVPAPQAAGALGLVEFRLTRDTRADGVALVARIALPADSGSQQHRLPSAVFDEQLLASGLADVTFRYLRRTADGVATDSSWPASGSPPDAIRIDLIGPAPRATTRTLVIRPVANVDGGCLFDPVSLACRL